MLRFALFTLFCAALFLSPKAVDAQAKPTAVGQSFTPGSRVVLYSTPQNGLVTKQRATALVAPSSGAAAVYPLTQQGKSYVTGRPEPVTELTIEGVRDVVQGRSVSTWLKVSGAGKSGWIKYDPAVTGSLEEFGLTVGGN